MRLNLKNSANTTKVFDDNGNLVGEILHSFISGLKEKIKIDNSIFIIRNVGFLGNEKEVYNPENKLVLKTDLSKNRIIHYKQYAETYEFRGAGLFSNKTLLLKESELILTANTTGLLGKRTFEVADEFDKRLVILFFINFYLNSLNSSNG